MSSKNSLLLALLPKLRRRRWQKCDHPPSLIRSANLIKACDHRADLLCGEHTDSLPIVPTLLFSLVSGSSPCRAYPGSHFISALLAEPDSSLVASVESPPPHSLGTVEPTSTGASVVGTCTPLGHARIKKFHMNQDYTQALVEPGSNRNVAKLLSDGACRTGRTQLENCRALSWQWWRRL